MALWNTYTSSPFVRVLGSDAVFLPLSIKSRFIGKVHYIFAVSLGGHTQGRYVAVIVGNDVFDLSVVKHTVGNFVSSANAVPVTENVKTAVSEISLFKILLFIKKPPYYI